MRNIALITAVAAATLSACAGPSGPVVVVGNHIPPIIEQAKAWATPKPTPQYATLVLGYPGYFTTVDSCFEGLAINTQFSKSLTLTEIQTAPVAQTYSVGLYSDSACSVVLHKPTVFKANQTIKLNKLSPSGAVWVFVNGSDPLQLHGPITITAKVIPL